MTYGLSGLLTSGTFTTKPFPFGRTSSGFPDDTVIKRVGSKEGFFMASLKTHVPGNTDVDVSQMFHTYSMSYTHMAHKVK